MIWTLKLDKSSYGDREIQAWLRSCKLQLNWYIWHTFLCLYVSREILLSFTNCKLKKSSAHWYGPTSQLRKFCEALIITYFYTPSSFNKVKPKGPLLLLHKADTKCTGGWQKVKHIGVRCDSVWHCTRSRWFQWS